jgi:hypothetical protein
MGLWYTYDFGDVEFTASFRYLPILVAHAIGGQLSAAAACGDARSCQPEFGGGMNGDPSTGIEGGLNVLRYRGQLDGALTRPGTIPLIEDIEILFPACSGIFRAGYGIGDVGTPIEPCVIGNVASVVDAETLEGFGVKDLPSLLLLARSTLTIAGPGQRDDPRMPSPTRYFDFVTRVPDHAGEIAGPPLGCVARRVGQASQPLGTAAKQDEALIHDLLTRAHDTSMLSTSRHQATAERTILRPAWLRG